MFPLGGGTLSRECWPPPHRADLAPTSTEPAEVVREHRLKYTAKHLGEEAWRLHSTNTGAALPVLVLEVLPVPWVPGGRKEQRSPPSRDGSVVHGELLLVSVWRSPHDQRAFIRWMSAQRRGCRLGFHRTSCPLTVQRADGGKSPHYESSGVPLSSEPREVLSCESLDFPSASMTHYFSTFSFIGPERLGSHRGKYLFNRFFKFPMLKLQASPPAAPLGPLFLHL